MDEINYLNKIKSDLLNVANWKQVELTKQWVNKIPSTAGVYVFKEKNEIVYVGETGNLRGRMTDLLDSRHHTIRRTIGEKLFSSVDGFIPASTKKQFPQHIELLVHSHICENLEIAFSAVSLGRKELEELIDSTINREIRLNKRGKRKSKD